MVDDEGNLLIIDLAGFFSWKELSELWAKRPKGLTVKAAIEQKFGPKRAKILQKFVATSEMPSWVFQSFSPVYLDRITDGAAYIQSLSELERDDKIDRRIEIKRLAWEYSEDTQDGVKTEPLSVYLDRVLKTITHPQ